MRKKYTPGGGGCQCCYSTCSTIKFRFPNSITISLGDIQTEDTRIDHEEIYPNAFTDQPGCCHADFIADNCPENPTNFRDGRKVYNFSSALLTNITKLGPISFNFSHYTFTGTYSCCAVYKAGTSIWPNTCAGSIEPLSGIVLDTAPLQGGTVSVINDGGTAPYEGCCPLAGHDTWTSTPLPQLLEPTIRMCISYDGSKTCVSIGENYRTTISCCTTYESYGLNGNGCGDDYLYQIEGNTLNYPQGVGSPAIPKAYIYDFLLGISYCHTGVDPKIPSIPGPSDPIPFEYEYAGCFGEPDGSYRAQSTCPALEECLPNCICSPSSYMTTDILEGQVYYCKGTYRMFVSTG